MKKIILILMSFVMIFALTSCSLFANKSSTSSNSSLQIIENTSSISNEGDDKNDDKNNSQTGKSIVIYFSRTNNTEKVADFIIEITNSDKYEIEAKIPYTDDDIKYYTDCRADREQKDPTARPEIGSVDIDLSNYDIIYLGYPIWHGQAPKIMYTFPCQKFTPLEKAGQYADIVHR